MRSLSNSWRKGEHGVDIGHEIPDNTFPPSEEENSYFNFENIG